VGRLGYFLFLHLWGITLTFAQKVPPIVPKDLGRGLKPADSLVAVIRWLSQQTTYEADTLRFPYMRKLMRIFLDEKPDTLPALAETTESWARQSRYPLAGGFVHLG
jgi:hypothetical protein